MLQEPTSSEDSQQPGRGRAESGRRIRRRVLLAVSGLLVLIVGAAAALLWVVAGKALTPIDSTPLNTHIVAAGPGTVTLPDQAANRYDGTYGLVWQDAGTGDRHHGVLGRILATGHGTVTRQLTAADTSPTPGAKAEVLVTVWQADPRQAVGLDYQDVTYPSSVGAMPAWYLPGTGSTWVIQVHGLGAGRAAGLRTMPQLHQLGYPILDITYRNDPGVPHDANGKREFGDAEWQDLDAAVRYAHSHGATGVVLYGYSMGGGIVETYLQRATDTSLVHAVVLDAPALDYQAAVHTMAGTLGLPGFVADLEAQVVQLRSGVNFDSVNALTANRRSGGPKQPVLIFHGTADTLVPYATSAAFARDWPGKVTLVTVEGASHTGAWNADPKAYGDHLAAFLRQNT